MSDQDIQRSALSKLLVLVPTYNERENLPLIIRRIRASVPDADVLVLDDNSPDGTGQVADELAADDKQIQVMHRLGKEGLGKAYLAGFARGLEQGYDALIEIDADGSHPPERLPAMLEAARDADVIIGSRWISGGKVVNWPLHRKALSVGGNIYVKTLLGMPVNDATAGFRIYRAQALRAIGLAGVDSYGYCFQADLTWRAIRAGLRVVEVPITFVEREIGQSKMNADIARESMLSISRWGWEYRRDQIRSLSERLVHRQKDRA